MRYTEGQHIVTTSGIHGVVVVCRRKSYQIDRRDWHGRLWVASKDIKGIYTEKKEQQKTEEKT